MNVRFAELLFVRRRVAFTAVFALVMLAVAMGIQAQPARACCLYNPSAAIAYADRWTSNPDLGDAKVYNPNYVDLSPNDCTNYLSQMLQAGGYPFHGAYGSGNDCSNVWWYGNQLNFSTSWSYAPCMNTFALNHPGDFTYWNNSPFYLSPGDFFLMELEGGGVPDHARVIVGFGNDVFDGTYTNLIDSHTNDRKHRAWSSYIPGGTPLWSWQVSY